jgi:phosphohistidine phosphatase
MQLLLVRHASAETRDLRRWPNDALRPLTTRGKRRFRRAATGIAQLGIVPDLCLSSPYRRALQTAEILHERAGWPEPVKTAWLMPGRRQEQLLQQLAGRRDGCVALVGHEPALGHLLSWLTTGNASAVRSRFRKGSVACLAFGSVPAPGRGELHWLLMPRALRAIGARR